MTLPGEETEKKRIVELRPMDVGDILDGTIRIYRAAPWTLIGIWAVIVGVPLAVQAYVLEQGRVTLEGDPEQLRNSEHVRKSYLGV